MTFLVPDWFMTSIFFMTLSSTKAPFFSDRVIWLFSLWPHSGLTLAYDFWRLRRMMKRSVRLLFLVL